jgi:hypothetical protein
VKLFNTLLLVHFTFSPVFSVFSFIFQYEEYTVIIGKRGNKRWCSDISQTPRGKGRVHSANTLYVEMLTIWLANFKLNFASLAYDIYLLVVILPWHYLETTNSFHLICRWINSSETPMHKSRCDCSELNRYSGSELDKRVSSRGKQNINSSRSQARDQ